MVQILDRSFGTDSKKENNLTKVLNLDLGFLGAADPVPLLFLRF